MQKLLTEGTACRARLKKVERVAQSPNQPANYNDTNHAPNA
jgi:hypothetical protein